MATTTPTTRVQASYRSSFSTRTILNPNLLPSRLHSKTLAANSYCFYIRDDYLSRRVLRTRDLRCHSPDFLLLIYDAGAFSGHLFPKEISSRSLVKMGLFERHRHPYILSGERNSLPCRFQASRKR